jgi:hypothetical protein
LFTLKKEEEVRKKGGEAWLFDDAPVALIFPNNKNASLKRSKADKDQGKCGKGVFADSLFPHRKRLTKHLFLSSSLSVFWFPLWVQEFSESTQDTGPNNRRRRNRK